MTVASVVVAVAVVAFVIIRLAPSPARPGAAVRTPLPTGLASYLGVYEAGPPQHYRPVAEFTKAVGEQPNLVGYYSGWGENFATSFAADGARARRCDDLAMGPDRRLDRDDRRRGL